ncbi:hypothetical protein ACFQGX_28045 [Nonomuraea dietziae]|uniref:hypothetical protein n=1 Tax=Nonomuraea dietziae TaxID=65515 RepID=UPI003617C037
MFDRFTDPARRAVMRAGILTMNAGRTSLATDLLLLGLAEEHPMPHLPDPAALRPHIDTGRTRELLAAIGIDVEEVRRRTRHGLDDPRLWRLERSRVAFLRVTLSGPMGVLPLRMHARKAIEVALWKPGPVTGAAAVGPARRRRQRQRSHPARGGRRRARTRAGGRDPRPPRHLRMNTLADAPPDGTGLGPGTPRPRYERPPGRRTGCGHALISGRRAARGRGGRSRPARPRTATSPPRRAP